ncbi:MAG TPA: extracellular solute-binding protein [Chloroflexota bacterium]|nr:extracellular solute-binding protein [Chloroflexota bacterium]
MKQIPNSKTSFPASVALSLALLTACGSQAASPSSAPASAPAAASAATKPSAAASAPAASVASKPGAAASVAASAKPAASTAPSAPADWQAQWDKTVAAAKQEGKVSVIIPPGDVYRGISDAFQKKYGISVELQVVTGQAELVPKLTAERTAGQYNWDVVMHSPVLLYGGLKPMQALDPIGPALILPEVLDDSKWLHGFNAGWEDSGKSLAYAFSSQVLWSAYVNRASTPESQLNKIDQLKDPQWKGKIALQDPRVPSAGTLMIAAWLQAKGEDSARAFLQNQQLAITQDRRQLVEWVLRGQDAVGMGIAPEGIAALSSQGADVSTIKPIIDDDPAASAVSNGTGALGLVNKAPHPNAAKVFMNWLLTQEGQVAYTKATLYNSRRLDVPVVDQAGAVDPNKKYSDLNSEDTFATYLKGANISKELLK